MAAAASPSGSCGTKWREGPCLPPTAPPSPRKHPWRAGWSIWWRRWDVNRAGGHRTEQGLQHRNGPRLACSDMGPSANCGPGRRRPGRGGGPARTGLCHLPRMPLGPRPGPLRRPAGRGGSSHVNRLWPFLASGSRSAAPHLPCYARQRPCPGVRMWEGPLAFLSPVRPAARLFAKGRASCSATLLARGPGKLRGAPRPAASGPCGEAPSLKLCKLRSAARPPQGEAAGRKAIGAQPLRPGRVPGKLFLEWVASLPSAQPGSSRPEPERTGSCGSERRQPAAGCQLHPAELSRRWVRRWTSTCCC